MYILGWLIEWMNEWMKFFSVPSQTHLKKPTLQSFQEILIVMTLLCLLADISKMAHQFFDAFLNYNCQLSPNTHIYKAFELVFSYERIGVYVGKGIKGVKLWQKIVECQV